MDTTHVFHISHLYRMSTPEWVGTGENPLKLPSTPHPSSSEVYGRSSESKPCHTHDHDDFTRLEAYPYADDDLDAEPRDRPRGYNTSYTKDAKILLLPRFSPRFSLSLTPLSRDTRWRPSR